MLTNLPKLKEDSAQQRIAIKSSVDAAKSRGLASREKGVDLKSKYEDLKKQLTTDPTAISLDEMEQVRHSCDEMLIRVTRCSLVR